MVEGSRVIAGQANDQATLLATCLPGVPEELNAGDDICYPADDEHLFKVLEPNTMAILLAEQN